MHYQITYVRVYVLPFLFVNCSSVQSFFIQYLNNNRSNFFLSYRTLLVAPVLLARQHNTIAPYVLVRQHLPR